APLPVIPLLFFFTHTATTAIYTLSLHDALPISPRAEGGDLAGHALDLLGLPVNPALAVAPLDQVNDPPVVDDHASGECHQKSSRSEEHTSELQSRENLVCRLLLEKKKHNNTNGR